jgi:hypothetical protein
MSPEDAVRPIAEEFGKQMDDGQRKSGVFVSGYVEWSTTQPYKEEKSCHS